MSLAYRRAVGWCSTVAVLTWSCGDAARTEPALEDVERVGVPHASVIDLGAPCTAGGSAIAGVHRWWDCNTQIALRPPASPNILTDLNAAIATWNDALRSEGVGGVPRFRVAIPQDADAIQIVVNGSGSTWCDATDVQGRTLTLTAGSPNVPPCGTNADNLRSTLVHALGHAVGLLSSWHQVGEQGISDHCSIHLLPDGRINGQVCQHELDALYMGYLQLPNTFPTDPALFWGRHIFNRIALGDTTQLALEVGDSVALPPAPPFFALAGDAPQIAAGSIGLTWQSTNQNVARVESPSNVLRALAVGSAVITGSVVEASLPATVRLGAVLRQLGSSVQVTVAPPTAGDFFRVVDISGSPVPITVAATYPFTASVIDGGLPADLRITWKVVYSYALQDTLTFANRPNPFQFAVHDGSYSFSIIATPKDLASDRIGASYAEEITVCTGSGLFSGGESPAAVEGCDGGIE